MILTAKTKNEIVNQLYQEKDINECTKMYSIHYEDIMQEIAIYLLSFEDSKLKRLYFDGQLKYYVISAIKNMAFSPTSQFQRKYFKDNIFLNEPKKFNTYILMQSDDADKVIKQTIKENYYNEAKALISAHPYKNEKYRLIYTTIFQLYFEDNLSIRKIAVHTKISKNAVFYYLKFIKELIQLNIKLEKYEY